MLSSSICSGVLAFWNGSVAAFATPPAPAIIPVRARVAGATSLNACIAPPGYSVGAPSVVPVLTYFCAAISGANCPRAVIVSVPSSAATAPVPAATFEAMPLLTRSIDSPTSFLASGFPKPNTNFPAPSNTALLTASGPASHRAEFCASGRNSL